VQASDLSACTIIDLSFYIFLRDEINHNNPGYLYYVTSIIAGYSARASAFLPYNLTLIFRLGGVMEKKY
jgi:hypothetical protein